MITVSELSKIEVNNQENFIFEAFILELAKFLLAIRE
jgi:hypothetical protein